MKQFVLPKQCRRIGQILFIISFIAGIIYMFFHWDPEWTRISVLSLFDGDATNGFSQVIKNRIVDECISTGLLVGFMMAFYGEINQERYASESIEHHLRLNSKTWGDFGYTICLLVGTWSLYQLTFFRFMIFLLFMPFIFSLIRLEYLIYKTRKSQVYEEQAESAPSYS